MDSVEELAARFLELEKLEDELNRPKITIQGIQINFASSTDRHREALREAFKAFVKGEKDMIRASISDTAISVYRSTQK